MTPEAASALLEMLASSPDLAGAVCTDAGVREVFDAATDSTAADVSEDALWACSRCPVLGACREWVTGLPAAQRPQGVVGGLVVADRGRLAGSRRARRSAA